MSNSFKKLGWDVVTLDNTAKFKPTILGDVTTWDYQAYFDTHPVPDVVWASPPCRTFTKQAWARHRDGTGTATTNDARNGDRCVRACLDCISHLRKRNRKLTFFVENPLHGAFRHLTCVQPLLRSGQYRAIQYGDYSPETHSLKPTLVLTNCDRWVPIPITATKSTTPWNTLSKKQRTIIPDAVCDEIALVCHQTLI